MPNIINERKQDFRIFDVDINKYSLDIKNISSLAGLIALNVFGHLGSEDKEIAEKEVYARRPLASYMSPELSIDHVNGVADTKVGAVALITSGIGSGTDGNGNLVLTPDKSNWLSSEYQATITKLLVKTNIVAGDCTDGNIVCRRYSAYLTSPNDASSGQREQLTFSAAAAGAILEVESGTTNDPEEIGDTDTFYGSADASAGGQDDELGLNPDAASPTYSLFYINIAAGAATKTYRFKFYLEY